MIKSSKAVALVLIGSIAALFGFKSCLDADAGGFFDRDGNATTRPSNRSTSSRGGHYFWHSNNSAFRSSGSNSASSSHSSTSRGGFGGSGHSAGA